MRIDVRNRAGASGLPGKTKYLSGPASVFFIQTISHESPRSADLWKTRTGTYKVKRPWFVSHKTRRFDDDNPCYQGLQHEPFGV